VGDSDGIVVVSVPDGSVCRCGEQMGVGERAGFDPARDEVICLHCLADRRAGRPQVLQRRPLRPAPAPAPYPADFPAHNPPNHPDAWAPPALAPRRAGTPRTLTTLLIAALVVALVGAAVVFRAVGLVPGNATRALDDPTAYVFMNTNYRGAPVTWDPCLTIELVVNSAAAPEGSDTLLAEAVERVNSASGLHLHIAGPTTQVPRPAKSARDLANGLPGSARAPVLVAWTTPEVVPGLEGSVVGLGGPVHRFANSLDQERYVGGSVDLDGPQLAQILRRPNGHAQARAVVMHELAHLVGLTHVDNPTQVMVASNGTATEFGKGDLAGLAKLGSGGCPYDLTPDSP
jgi:hypothetical protein